MTENPVEIIERTTGTRVRWEQYLSSDDHRSDWTDWLECYRAEIDNNCIKIVKKNVVRMVKQNEKYYVDITAPPLEHTYIEESYEDVEFLYIPLQNISGRIEIVVDPNKPYTVQYDENESIQ